MKLATVIVAGGKGERMGNALPKQFIPLLDQPIIIHTIQNFLAFDDSMLIILVLPATQIEYAKEILHQYQLLDKIHIIIGGNTRYESVQNGINAIQEADIVMIHDGVRPIISKTLIQNCIQGAQEKGNAIPCVSVTDTIRSVNTQGIKYVDRNELRAMQTPQTFKFQLIKDLLAQPEQATFTDEASVLEHEGICINLVEGDKKNIKITTPDDLIIGPALLQAFYEENK